jgi:Phospholipase_D-nuclease N-terminal
MTSSPVALPTVLQMLLGLYGYLLPLLLYVLWSTLALWDLSRRADLRPALIWGWTLAIFALPFIGPIAYLFLGGSQIPSRARMVTVGGGAAAYVLVLLLGAALGGVS